MSFIDWSRTKFGCDLSYVACSFVTYNARVTRSMQNITRRPVTFKSIIGAWKKTEKLISEGYL